MKCGCFSLQESESETEDMKEIREMASKIRVKKKIMKVDSRIDGGVKRQPLPRTSTAAKRSRSVARLKGEFTELGVDMTGTEDANFTKTRGRSTSKAGKQFIMEKNPSSSMVSFIYFSQLYICSQIMM